MDRLIDLHSNGKIVVHQPKEEDKCYKEFKKMMNCIRESKLTENCKKKILAWDKCKKF